MSEERRPRKCPCGTIRHWESGTVIKAHDNSQFSDGWLSMPRLPGYIEDAIASLDRLGKWIAAQKLPIDGSLWCNKLITEFRPSSGALYSVKDFTQYSGFYGNEGYSFRSEFSKRYSSDKIEAKAKINELVLTENTSEKGISLTPERIDQIKQHVKSMKFTNSFNPTDITELNAVLKKVEGYLKQGEDFEDPNQKAVYQKNKELLLHFNDTYEKVKVKRALRETMLAEIDDAFQDNWGIRESFRKNVDKAYSKYIKDNIDQIKIDEIQDFEQVIGCSVSAPTDEFYTALDNSEIVKKKINLEEYIGKRVPDYYNKFEDVILQRISSDGSVIVLKDGSETNYISAYTDQDELNVLQSALRAREGTDLSIVFQLRFSDLYSKDLRGEWDIADIPALHTFEKVMHYLPEGHCKTNSLLKVMDKDTKYTQKGNYAHYSPDNSSIYLSNSAMSSSDKFSELNEGNQFVSVLIHEIGHAVSQKFKRAERTMYRDFSRQCGWGWDYLDKDDIDTYHATGDDKDIKRTGANNSVKLITNYAHKSPEEAFAEYYSFYNQYKSEINNFLDKNNVEGLHKDIEVINNPQYGKEVTVGSIVNTNIDPVLRENIDKELFSQFRKVEDNISLQFESPWKIKHQTVREDTVDKKQLRNYINFVKKNDHKPLIAIQKANGVKTIIGDEGSGMLNMANKTAQKLTPICVISEEFHTNLRNKGFSDKDIEDYAFHNIKDEKYPLSEKTKWEKREVKGLRYGSNGVIDAKTIIGSKEIFKKMRNIYYSPELKKALEN